MLGEGFKVHKKNQEKFHSCMSLAKSIYNSVKHLSFKTLENWKLLRLKYFMQSMRKYPAKSILSNFEQKKMCCGFQITTASDDQRSDLDQNVY